MIKKSIAEQFIMDTYRDGEIERLQRINAALLEVVQAMAKFDGRNNNAALKQMARDALAKAAK